MSGRWNWRTIFGGAPRRKDGWAGQWDRHRWPMPAPRRRRVPPGDIRIMVWAGLLIGLLAAQAARPWPPSFDTGGTPAVRIIDGDTFDHGGVRIRIADIDTPEVRGRCPYETELAARATRRLSALLAAGPFELEPIAGRDTDRYGRKLRIVTRGGRSLGDMLVAEGLARTWSGRREPWC